MKAEKIISAILLLCGLLFAQHRHEFSVYLGGGLSALSYDAITGAQSKGAGGLGGLGYSYFFNEKLGLRSGMELAFYNSKYKLGDFSIKYDTEDYEGEVFEFRSRISGYEEKHGAAMLQIPLMAQLQLGGDMKYYLALGMKAGFPLSSSCKGSNAKLENSGHYEKEDYEYTEQDFVGFGEHTAKGKKGNANFGTAWLASAETGAKFKISEGMSLYAGAYLDYGINSILKRNSTPSEIIEYNTENPKVFSANSILKSSAEGKHIVKKISPMAIGIKLQLAFGSGEAREVEPPPP